LCWLFFLEKINRWCSGLIIAEFYTIETHGNYLTLQRSLDLSRDHGFHFMSALKLSVPAATSAVFASFSS